MIIILTVLLLSIVLILLIIHHYKDKFIDNKINLVNFKNIHYNKDIYVIASGSSCNFIDKSFFSNKITIGVNQVYKKFDVNYIVRKDYKLIHETIKNLKNNQILFISKGSEGNDNINNKLLIEKQYNNFNNIVVYDHNINKLDINEKIIKNLTKNQLLTSHSTITTAIYLAWYMGAKNIILVGHDCGTINNKSNFDSYHNDTSREQKNENDYIKWLNKIENQTIKLKKYLYKYYNCNVHSINPFVSFRLEGNKFK